MLLSSAGLAGLIGVPLGGFISDKAGSCVAAAVSGGVSGIALAAVLVGLSLGAGVDTTTSPLLVEGSFWRSKLNGLGGPKATAFTLLVLVWSVDASAQCLALTSLAQENAPAGSETTALGLPRAVGDGTYIVAPLILL